jgi:hypothetical protein
LVYYLVDYFQPFSSFSFRTYPRDLVKTLCIITVKVA